MNYATLSVEDLLHACTSTGDSSAWEEFIRRFHRHIALVALRTARHWGESSQQTVDDLVQETYLRLCRDNCRVLRGFESRHINAFYGFIKVVTANIVHDHFKSTNYKRLHEIRSEDSNHLGEREAAALSAWPAHEKSPELSTLIREIDASIRCGSTDLHYERDRRIFWLYYRLGLSARAIGQLPSIRLGTKGVESTILRLTRHVREYFSNASGRHTQTGQREGNLPAKPLY